MNERTLYSRVAKELNNPIAIEKLKIGTMPGRFAKIQDSWGKDKRGNPVRMFNHVDYLWATDCLELKAVKAKTPRGMIFYPRRIEGKQLEYLEKYNGLLAVAFIQEREKNDVLICIPVVRWWQVKSEEKVTISGLVGMSNYIVNRDVYFEFVREAKV